MSWRPLHPGQLVRSGDAIGRVISAANDHTVYVDWSPYVEMVVNPDALPPEKGAPDAG